MSRTTIQTAALCALLATAGTCLADCSPTAADAEPTPDPKIFAEATALGLTITGSWRPNSVQIVKAPAGYPLFVVVGGEAEDPSSDFLYVLKAYFKKSADAPLQRVLEYGRPMDLAFSPSGKQVMLTDNALSNYTETLIVPTEAFGKGGQDPQTLDKRLQLTFYAVDLKPIVRLSPYFKAAFELAGQGCVHEYYIGKAWLTENTLATALEVTNCGKDWKYGHWHAVFDLKTLKFSSIEIVKD